MTPYAPISKFSQQIHRHKDDTDERPIVEKCLGACEVAAAKGDITPNDKPHRFVCKDNIEKCRRWGKCQVCELPDTTKKRIKFGVHHIDTKNAFGGDEDENLVYLCGICHEVAHMRGIPDREELRRLAADRIRIQGVAPNMKALARLMKEQNETPAASSERP